MDDNKDGKWDGNPDHLPDFREMTEAEYREFSGTKYTNFMDTRIMMVREKLNPAMRELFDKLPYFKKCYFITQLFEKGAIV